MSEVRGQDGVTGDLNVLPAIINERLECFPLNSLTISQIIALGTQTQQKLGTSLSELLSEVSKNKNPVLYETFKRLKDGVTEANLDELEKKVRQSEEDDVISKISRFIGLSDPAKKAQKLVEELREMLSKKSKTLLDLVKDMEIEAGNNTLEMLSNLETLERLANAYLDVIDEFHIDVETSYALLNKAKKYEEVMKMEANKTGDAKQISSAQSFGQLVVQIENRSLTLKQAYEKIPANLKIVEMAKGAAGSSLAEIANNLVQQFNDIKTALITWNIMINIQESQVAEEQRQEIAKMLSKHQVTVLDRVVTTAEATPYQRRLDEAKLFMEIVNSLEALNSKVEEIRKVGQEKFTEAEKILKEAHKKLAKV